MVELSSQGYKQSYGRRNGHCSVVDESCSASVIITNGSTLDSVVVKMKSEDNMKGRASERMPGHLSSYSSLLAPCKCSLPKHLQENRESGSGETLSKKRSIAAAFASSCLEETLNRQLRL